MSTFRNPVGPQSPATYWRRRLMVVLGLVAVIVVVVLIVVRPGSDAADAKSGSSSSDQGSVGGAADGGDAVAAGDDETDAAASADAEQPATPIDPKACKPGVITIEAVTDKVTYAAGEKPLISMKVTNTGGAECDLAVGTDIQEFRITSGSEQYWSSLDCQATAAPQTVTIAPGDEGAMSTTPIPWDRTRSDPATCDGDRPAVPAGGASYHLTVQLGELQSASKQILVY